MTDIVERIRSLRYVHVPVASQLMDEAAAEIERLRLTDDERAAIEFAICSLGRDHYLNERHAERLKETLERYWRG